MIISILIAVIVALLLVTILVAVKNIKRKDENVDVSQKIQKKGKSAILKEAEKKLAHDPHNVNSLELIGDIYFSENGKKFGAFIKPCMIFQQPIRKLIL